MSEQNQGPTSMDLALKEANDIGRMLRDRYNMQAATDQNGLILPPPTIFDLKATDLGKPYMGF